MRELEQLLVLFVAAVLLAAAARRVGAPYPVFLALGGALLAFFPGAPSFTVPPELALALFVAPVLGGSGPTFAPALPSPRALTRLASRQVGEDVLLEAYVHEP